MRTLIACVCRGAATLMVGVFLCCHCNGQTGNTSGGRVQTTVNVTALEKGCVVNLRTLNTAQITYWGGNDSKGFARTLTQLGPEGEGLVSESMVAREIAGYRFRLVVAVDIPEGTPIKHYSIIAEPSVRLSKHQRSYYTDETGIIRFTEVDHDPASSDPPLEPPQDR